MTRRASIGKPILAVVMLLPVLAAQAADTAAERRTMTIAEPGSDPVSAAGASVADRPADASSLAIVVQDPVVLRAAPAVGAAQNALLRAGDLLEIRGQRNGQLQAWDRRHERGGYVRAGEVRRIGTTPADAQSLLAVLRFVRETPGAESLGIAYAAAYLKAAPTLAAEAFAAIGEMADRLANRAASARGAAADAVSAQLDVVAGYGIAYRSVERDGRTRLCYDGDAHSRVLAMPDASPGDRAAAVLALTRTDCDDPARSPVEREAIADGRIRLVERIVRDDPARLPGWARKRIHLRAADLWASRAYDWARRRKPAATAAAERAISELAAVERADLAEEDLGDYEAAAVHVGALAWLAAPPAPASRLTVRSRAGEPGQTCVDLFDAQVAPPRPPLASRCTFGLVLDASARTHPNGRALALAVELVDGWTETWVFRAADAGWTVDVLGPDADGPGVGYAEFAGWVPGADPALLLVREAAINGQVRRGFEVIGLGDLETRKRASRPALLAAFGRWSDAGWKMRTLSLR